MKKVRILVLPGDGIGPEVVQEAVRVLERGAQVEGVRLEIEQGVIGGAAIDKVGEPLPPEVLSRARRSDAVLLGAVGGPAWDGLPAEKRPEQALLGLRRGLQLFANLRPAKIFRSLVGASTLKAEVVSGIDLLVVRELTGGIYFGRPRGIRNKGAGGRRERAINTEVYSVEEVERIARVAFEMAGQRRRQVTSVDKANILETSMLWREVATRVGRDYPEVRLEHLYVDACAMQLVRDPRRFDVLLTSNLFGDILSDEAAMLTGSIGMLPSASLGAKKNHLGFLQGLYEPVHGSAPDIAGQGLANPLATVLSCAMMVRLSLGLSALADRVEKAVESLLDEGFRTSDIATDGTTQISTQEMGRLLYERIGK